MKQEFKDYIKARSLFKKTDRILLAVSGGIDSICMMHLMLNAGYKNIVVAHCNFSLRGKESDGDALFVKKAAHKAKVPFVTITFDTKKYAKDHSLSIQMAARELRYNWFEHIRAEYKCTCIAVAHNHNDTIETFFINLTRGTGIKGLTGIKEKQKYIVRPLLCATREEIAQYAKQKKIAYREDSSNAETKYLRNAIRHKIMPILKELNPSFEKNFTDTLSHLGEVYAIYAATIQVIKESIVIYKNSNVLIPIKYLKELSHKETVLFEILHEYNFSTDSIQKVIDVLDKQAGKQFFSSTHTLVKDREHLIISRTEHSKEIRVQITKNTKEIRSPLHINISTKKKTAQFKISTDPCFACIDADTLKYPLTLRKWKAGDFFYPLGMTKRKKLSDFLTDKKLSRIDKNEVHVITSGNDVVWVAGMRIDDRYKITPHTKHVLEMEVFI